jgi:hypothetical protein
MAYTSQKYFTYKQTPLPTLIHDVLLHDTPLPTKPQIRKKNMHLIVADRLAHQILMWPVHVY